MTLDELKSWFNEFRTNWKRAALFLAAIIVIVILVAYVTSFVGEKAKMHATSEETDTSKKEILPENEELQKKDDKKFQTLHEYFKTDFSNYLAANRKVGIRIFPDVSKPEEKQNYELEFRLHCDFESLTKFISAYFPSSTFPNASPICKVVAEQINEISNLLSKGVIVAGSRYDDRMTEIDDLKFTGRVYIYHDTYLSDDEKDELRLFYKQKNLDPRFQGSNYLAKMFPYKRTSTD
jgi:hypothetical protein